MSGGIVSALQFAIDGVTDQQNTIANNLANTQTPDYTDSEVSFEQSLQQALAAPGPETASITTDQSTAAANSEGNNVSLNTELLESETAALHYSTISESINAQFRLDAGSAGGSYT